MSAQPRPVRVGLQMLTAFAGCLAGISAALSLDPASPVPLLIASLACLALFLLARLFADADVSEPRLFVLLGGWTFTFALLLFSVGGILRPRRISRDLAGAFEFLLLLCSTIGVAIGAPTAAVVAGFRRAASESRPAAPPGTSGAGLHLAIAGANFVATMALLIAALTVRSGVWQIVALAALVVLWPPAAIALSAVAYRVALSKWQVTYPPALVRALDTIRERTDVSFARVMSLDPEYGQGRVCHVIGVPGSPTLAISASLATSLPADQLVAVLAHEAAHVRRRHIAWRVAWTTGIAVVAIATSTALFVFIAPLFHRGWRPVASFLALSPMLVARGLYDAHVSRRHEAEADRFAVGIAGADALLGALEAIQLIGPAPPLMPNHWTTHGTWEVRSARIRATASVNEVTINGHAHDRDSHLP